MLRVTYYTYSTERLVNIRRNYSLKICYSKQLSFLKLKSYPAKNLSNRISIGSKFHKSLKTLYRTYIYYIRHNFLCKKHKIKHYYKSYKDGNFSTPYKQYIALNDLDRSLLWRALQIQPLFKIVTKAQKLKKKKIFYTHNIFFTYEPKRILITWVWLKNFIKSLALKNLKIQLLLAFENFLNSTENNHVIHNVKLQVYKIQLLRSL